METPIVMVNVKTYQEGMGGAGLHLAKVLEKVAGAVNANVAVAVQPVDLHMITNQVKIPVLGQHVDPIGFGSHTGWILPESLKEAGATGTLINHSEKPLPREKIQQCVLRARDVGLETIVCTATVEKSLEAAVFSPDFIAIEPPELIGGDISVTTADPHIVKDTVLQVHGIDPRVKILCGAGIKTGEDVATALKLGAQGVLLASGVVKSSHVEKTVANLLKGLRQKN